MPSLHLAVIALAGLPLFVSHHGTPSAASALNRVSVPAPPRGGICPVHYPASGALKATFLDQAGVADLSVALHVYDSGLHGWFLILRHGLF